MCSLDRAYVSLDASIHQYIHSQGRAKSLALSGSERFSTPAVLAVLSKVTHAVRVCGRCNMLPCCMLSCSADALLDPSGLLGEL